MESEGTSPSDESQSSSDSSDEASSGQDEERLEPATILGTTFEFPQDLCEDPEIFKEFFSMKTWESLSENETEHLKRFLPNFEVNDAEEKNITVEKLFAREIFNFTSPLVEFHQKLRDGAFRPDLARMQKVFQKARQHHSRHQWRAECYKTMQEVLVCRERLLALAHASAPGSHLLQSRPVNQNLQAPPPPSLHLRAKRRYFQELAAIRSEVCGGDGDAQFSEDENFPDGPPPPHSNAKQHRRQNSHSQLGAASAAGLNGNFPPLTEEWRRRALAAHRLRKVQQSDHPELNTAGITLGCVRGRCGVIGAAPAESGGGRARRPARPRAPPVPAAPPVHVRILSPHPQSNVQHQDSASDEEPFVPTPPAPPPIPRMAEPPPLVVRAPPPPQPAPPPPQEPALGEDLGVELVQATHACFLSVVRDLVCGTPRHCLPLPQLAARLRRWRQNPIAPLNHWYSGAEDWVKALPSAVAFLAGEGEGAPSPDDFVPYLQYKPATQVYQWIGAGRDSDALLAPLCATWLARRQAAAKPAVRAAQALPTPAPPPPVLSTPQRLTSLNQPDRWQKDEGSELESFRSQERARFQRPHRAFTYRLAEAVAVVGPLKGVYACEENGGGRGARGHSLLASARPRHVTLLALVRDAVACLPDGEGTRAHITALLRRSQYLVSDAGEQALQAAVSGALDRMHCAPDPCVRYLPARKLWLYLHRDRTEEEFERLHAEVQGKTTTKGKGGAAAGGSRRAGGARAAPVPEATPPPPTPPRVPAASPRRCPVPSPSRSISVNVTQAEDEDVNVDVEGTEPPLSPALTPSPSPPPASPAARIDATSAAVSSISGISYQRMVPVSVSVSSEKITNVGATINVVTASSAAPPPVAVSVSTPIVATFANVRQPQITAARSMVRVLSPAAPGKSLISPRALRPSTPPPSTPTTRGVAVGTTQAKVVVQRTGTQAHTTGALPLSHQRILLESLMQHQRTHGQPMSHDQLLHTIHSTQKLSSSPPVTPGSVAASPKPQQTIHLAGQTVQLASGQTVQLTGQTVQLTGQTVRLTGQTVQLGGQTVRLADPTLRPQKQTGPLVAKILTNAQTSASSLVGSNIAEGAGTTATLSHPQTQPHHTLLLSNLGGQVVRVASGGGALLGPALRLQAASPATHHLTQARAGGVGGASVLLGGQALKLQAAPVRLHHQNAAVTAGAVSATMSGGRVVLAGGARLHGLKLLPMHHTIRGVGAGRQVYARIVTPASAPRPLPAPVRTNDTSINPAPPTTPRTQ